jgi:hypothetical protein
LISSDRRFRAAQREFSGSTHTALSSQHVHKGADSTADSSLPPAVHDEVEGGGFHDARYNADYSADAGGKPGFKHLFSMVGAQPSHSAASRTIREQSGKIWGNNQENI